MAEVDRLTALPTELRAIIYETVLTPDMSGRQIVVSGLAQPDNRREYTVVDGVVRPDERNDAPPGLLGVSRQVRTEATQIYFNMTEHLIETSVSDLPNIVDWVSRIVAVCGRRPLAEDAEPVTIILLTPGREYEEVLPILQMLRATGLDPSMLRFNAANTKRV